MPRNAHNRSKKTGSDDGASRAARAAQQAACDARALKVQRVQVIAGLVIVAAVAVAAYFVNVAVGVGFTILALARIWILRRELRRQAADGGDPEPPAPRPKGRRVAAGRPAL